MAFKGAHYAIINNNPSHLISIKINHLLPCIYESIEEDQIHEVQFIFCNAATPQKSFEVYQFIIKPLEVKKNNRFTDTTLYTLEQRVTNLLKCITAFCRCKPRFLSDFSTYFRLHFVEHAPLPNYKVPYYEINAYHQDNINTPVVYKTTTLGSVSTGFHEVTLIAQHDLININQYLKLLHENYEVETNYYNILDSAISSDELSDEEVPGPSCRNN